MDLVKEFKKIKAYIYKWHQKDRGDWFPDANGKCIEKEDSDEYMREALDDPQKNVRYIAIYFEAMATWKIYQTQHALLYKVDRELYYKEFSETAEYNYLAIAIRRKSQNNLGFDTVGFALAMNILARRERQYTEIAEAMIYSLDKFDLSKGTASSINQVRGTIVYGGNEFNPAIWFILDLYCLFHNRNYSKENADLPKNYTPYDAALQEWDTTDLNKVDQLVYNMCDLHILRAIKKSDDREQEFHWNEYQLFVFEIEVWLTFRAMRGLENPKEYSHYLMQEPLSTVFPIKEPLAYPDLPELEQLLTLHHEVYPNEEALEILTNYKNERKDG